MTIFGLKIMVKGGLEFFILKSYVPLLRYLLTCKANSAADLFALGNFEGARMISK